jgi:hypothetical protein
MEVYRKAQSKTPTGCDIAHVSGSLSHEACGEGLGESRRR